MKKIISGLPAAGKTSLLRSLEKTSLFPNAKLIDLDEYIEKEIFQTPISNFIETNGWETFRRIEAESLTRLLDSTEHIVCALGGGTLTTQLLSREDCEFFWLDCSVDESWNRIKDDTSRPLRLLGEQKVRTILNQRVEVSQDIKLRFSSIEDMLSFLKKGQTNEVNSY